MAFPAVSKLTEMFCVRAAGAVLSIIVTVAVALELFPLVSVTDSVTVFGPTFVQSKLVWSSVKVAMPQLSFEPLSTSEVVMMAFPLASRLTDMFCVTTVGTILSFMVTVAVALAVLPLVSVTVKVTVLVPILVQSKLV